MLTSVISKFSIPGAFIKAERFGSGLINDTYLCEFREGDAVRKYILQRINTSVFQRPEQVMENVEIVTLHIVNRLRAQGVNDPYGVTPALIYAKNDRSHYIDAAGAFWRVFHFIESGTVFDTVKGAKHAFEIGRGLGRFQALVSDLAPEKLHDTLPGFHRTPVYLKEFDDALKSDAKNRAAEVKAEIGFVNRRRSLAAALTDVIDSKQVPLRVVHNDPKVNNVLIHSETGEAVCMVDLDTVKPGVVHFDFGDCVRSAANPAGEDAENLDDVRFDLIIYDALTKGYLSEARSFLTTEEIETLPISVNVITFELGLRFLTDYLKGDAYFKIKYPAHNLHRSRVQFRLLERIEAVDDKMVSIVKNILKH